MFPKPPASYREQSWPTRPPFAAHRVSLVRHGRRTFLAPAERLFNFQNFGFLEMPDFQGKFFKRGHNQSQAAHDLGVSVALQYLG